MERCITTKMEKKIGTMMIGINQQVHGFMIMLLFLKEPIHKWLKSCVKTMKGNIMNMEDANYEEEENDPDYEPPTPEVSMNDGWNEKLAVVHESEI